MYGSYELKWVCRSNDGFEFNRQNTPRYRTSLDYLRRSIFDARTSFEESIKELQIDVWPWIATDYSRRHLSDPEDKLCNSWDRGGTQACLERFVYSGYVEKMSCESSRMASIRGDRA